MAALGSVTEALTRHAVGVEPDVDDALRAVIETRMLEKGLNPAGLAEAASVPRDRMYKALSGKRKLTPETLVLIAEGLRTTVTALRLEAGVLTTAERSRLARRIPFTDYIGGDPFLSREAKDLLIRLYEQLSDKAALPAAARIRQLKERVSEHERDVSELQRLLAQRAKEADAG